MGIIYLIRHGQASFGKQNYDELSELGVRQSKLLAEHMLNIGLHPHAVYSGTLSRQKATASEFVNSYLKAGCDLPEVISMSAFDEFDSEAIIRAAAAKNPDLKLDLKSFYTDPSVFKKVFEFAMLTWVTTGFNSSDLETWEHAKERVSGALRRIADTHGKSKHIVVFTSGGAIAASMAHFLDITGDTVMRLNWQIVNTSVTRYMYNSERMTLSGFNWFGHLETLNDASLITYR